MGEIQGSNEAQEPNTYTCHCFWVQIIPYVNYFIDFEKSGKSLYSKNDSE